MRKVRFRPRAWIDAQECALYLAANAGEDIAQQFLIAVEESTESLGHLSARGAPCTFLHPELKEIRRIPVAGFENWLVFYRVAADGVEVVRILHGAREIEKVMAKFDEGL